LNKNARSTTTRGDARIEVLSATIETTESRAVEAVRPCEELKSALAVLAHTVLDTGVWAIARGAETESGRRRAKMECVFI
jgi:hypothetical protein